MKVYIAAPWVNKEDAKAARDQFVVAGIEVTSRWLDYPDNSTSEAYIGQPTDHGILKQEAVNDIEDIINANGMVILQLAKSEGKAFEQGLLLGLSTYFNIQNKMIIVSPDGSRGNVFQYIDEVYTIVPTVETAIEEVLKWV